MKDTSVIIGMAAIAVVIGVVIFLNGGISNTQSAATGANNPVPVQAVAVPFTKIVSGTESKVSTRVNYLITSPSELSKLWGMISATGTPPAVDFTTHAVIAVFAGRQPTTGYAIAVAKIEDSTTRNVSLTIAKPDTTCTEGQTVTAPYEIVTVPATTLPLAHTDQVVTKTCTN